MGLATNWSVLGVSERLRVDCEFMILSNAKRGMSITTWTWISVDLDRGIQSRNRRVPIESEACALLGTAPVPFELFCVQVWSKLLVTVAAGTARCRTPPYTYTEVNAGSGDVERSVREEIGKITSIRSWSNTARPSLELNQLNARRYETRGILDFGLHLRIIKTC